MAKKSRSKKSPHRPYARDYSAQRFRMHRLHDLLDAEETVEVGPLAQEFGVTIRTIKEDIRVMRDDYAAPIEWSAKEHSYVYTKPYKGIALLRLNDKEALALALSARKYGASPGSPLGRAFKSVLEKIEPLLGGDTSFALEALRDVVMPADDLAATEDRYIPRLQEAIVHRREVRIVYRKPAEAARERTVRPLHLAYLGQRWVLLARDVAKPADDRTFLLSRMEGAEQTDAVFQRPADFDPQKMLRGNLGRFTGTGDYEVRIVFDAAAAPYAREAIRHESAKFTERPDGRTELVLRLNNLIDIEKDVLRYGEQAEVVSPPELRAKLREVFRAGLARYEST